MRSLRRLPPLNALRTYEAAARHLNFTKAAEELGVTPAAVSHQVRMLEDYIGIPLFRRVNRQLLLTEAGAACLPGIRAAFDGLASAIEQISVGNDSGILNVSVAPSFAAKWLLPRLDRFQAAHPEIDVRVAASMELADFTNTSVDLAIRYGAGRYPGLTAERLLSEAVLPVCSPTLLEGPRGLRTPADIRFHTLLHDDSPDDDETCPTWEMWLRAAGVAGVDANRGPRFNQSSLVLEAAVLGRGVALAKLAIAAEDLANGRVVCPFATNFPVEFAYYMVLPESRQVSRKVQLFQQWLREEARSTANRALIARSGIPADIAPNRRRVANATARS